MRILIVKVSSLGDVVHNMPVVQDVLRAHPDAQIDWLVEENFADLVRMVKGVRKVIPLALRRWRKSPFAAKTRQEWRAFRNRLGQEQYDVVIDSQGLVKTGWLTSLVSLAPHGRVIGLGNRTEDSGYEWLSRLWYREKISIPTRVHVVTRSRILFAKALGYAQQQAPSVDTIVPFPMDFGLHPAADVVVPNAPPQPYVVLIHATSRADKCWPDADWIALGQRLQAQGYSLVLPWGSASEKVVSERLQKALQHSDNTTPQAYVPSKMNLVQVTALLDRAVAVVGVDTGLVHIAAALEKPTIELYNFTTAWRTGGFWSPQILNLGQAGDLPTLAQVTAGLQQLNILQH